MKFPAPGELIVMRILKSARTGLYGLQIVEASKGELTRNGIYVQLDRLEAKGYVTSMTPASTGKVSGMPRPLYKLSANGTRMLRFIDESTTDDKSTA
jgi:DNA-binding PadR family transcriptional regulator